MYKLPSLAEVGPKGDSQVKKLKQVHEIGDQGMWCLHVGRGTGAGGAPSEQV